MFKDFSNFFLSPSLPSEITESVDRQRNSAAQRSMAIEAPSKLVNATQSAKLFCVFAVFFCDFFDDNRRSRRSLSFSVLCQQARLKANKRRKKRKIKPMKLIQSFCFPHLDDFDFHELVSML